MKSEWVPALIRAGLAGWMAGWIVVARGYMYSATKEYELNCTVLFPCVRFEDTLLLPR